MIFTFILECLMSEVKCVLRLVERSRGLQALIKQTVENGYFAFFLSLRAFRFTEIPLQLRNLI